MNQDFSNAHILVLGDLMLDRYWQGATHRISPEAPVPVVHVQDQYERIGGSGNVAMNITSLGARASLLGIIGDDEAGRQVKDLLGQSNIQHYCQVESSVPTTTKLRVLSQHQQLIRLDFEQPHQHLDASVLIDQYQALLQQVNLVVLSDYGKGLLEDAQPFIQLASGQSIPVLIDPKKQSFENYAGAWLLTPNQKEFEAVVGSINSQAELIEKAGLVIRQHDLGGLLITQGEQGMTLVMKDQMAEHFPTHAQEVYDVTGAGDTVIASLASGVGSGMSIRDAVFLSCKAAAIVVGRLGTASVTQQDLQQADRMETHKLSPIEQKIHDREQCLQNIAELKQQGRKIVVTNGCFDLLHSGHVSYLQQAAELGDVLIVAVNSDQSVTELKGPGRPVNALDDRMKVLASLASVDMVVSFSEQTPADLYRDIQPDILVKGGDYQVEEIAGREYAGEVVLIDLVEGKSSSVMINKIRD